MAFPTNVSTLKNDFTDGTVSKNVHRDALNNTATDLMAVEGITVGPTHFNLLDPQFGGRRDGVTDNAAAFLALFNKCGPSTGDGVTLIGHLPQGSYKVKTPFSVPSKVQLEGDGDGSKIIADPAFSGSYVGRLGLGVNDPNTRHCRIKGLTIDCGNIVGLKGVYSNELNEQSGLDDVAIVNYRLYGVHLEQSGNGCYNWWLKDLTLSAATAATNTVGIRVENSSNPGLSMSGTISRVSIVPWAGAAQQQHAIHLLATAIRNGSYVMVNIDGIIHVENHVNGVFFDHESTGQVRGIEATANVGSCVRINNDSSWAFTPGWEVVVSNAFNNGGGVAITDVINSYTSGARKGFYSTSAPVWNGGLSGRIQMAMGADVAAALNTTLGLDGNTFQITAGVGQINCIDTTGWQNGAEITLYFNGTVTVKHNQATSGNFYHLNLAGGDFAAVAFSTLTLKLMKNGYWNEIGRKA